MHARREMLQRATQDKFLLELSDPLYSTRYEAYMLTPPLGHGWSASGHTTERCECNCARKRTTPTLTLPLAHWASSGVDFLPWPRATNCCVCTAAKSKDENRLLALQTWDEAAPPWLHTGWGH